MASDGLLFTGKALYNYISKLFGTNQTLSENEPFSFFKK